MGSTTGRIPAVDRRVANSTPSFDVEAFAARYGGTTVSRLSAGTLIFAQGEPADTMYYVQDGQVQITVVSSQGKEGILAVLESGSFFGEGSLLDNRTRVATATCLVASVVARLERASVVRAIREDPAIAEFFILFAFKSIIGLRDNLISQLFDSSERRLARALLILANYGRNGTAAHVIRNIDQEALAQMIGTTRSRVNQFMNKFRRLHHIDYDGNVIIVHKSLADLAPRGDTAAASEDLVEAC